VAGEGRDIRSEDFEDRVTGLGEFVLADTAARSFPCARTVRATPPATSRADHQQQVKEALETGPGAEIHDGESRAVFDSLVTAITGRH
jgi:hypothetical protein